jgi:hypothetical protein
MKKAIIYIALIIGTIVHTQVFAQSNKCLIVNGQTSRVNLIIYHFTQNSSLTDGIHAMSLSNANGLIVNNRIGK